ncbi:reverse transcriptase family protein [Yoonia sp. I 8.24]|uniref:reverse transcriptase family protein n=1 Tax=Yoonia sp. I 8.24 TaxID=1537229 RepID=UPI001EDF6B45|nr:reverse transcriptase family protein [Yoonia sp. I 8.24]MCG3268036.1 RNA-directed DNA polymerase [Yoonia sp. I 8.24]
MHPDQRNSLKIFARLVAPSLAKGRWAVSDVTGALKRRLPAQFQREAQLIAEDLVAFLPAMTAPNAGAISKALCACDAFVRLHGECLRRGLWPDPDLNSGKMLPLFPFARLDLPNIPTFAALADWLVIDGGRLMYMADIANRHNEHPDAPVHHYLYGLRPKPTGGYRVIEAPKSGLKALQRQILRGILDKVPVHSDAFGFVRGKSCAQAANRHCGAQTVVGFDLRDFFPNLAAARVFGLFRRLGYPDAVARTLTGLCTTTTPQRVRARLPHLQGQLMRTPHLPQGAPSSPALANLIAFTLDRRLAGLARALDAQYSRYADDLTFSGDAGIAPVLTRAVPHILQEEGFVLNPRKTRVRNAAQRQVVTGIVVNQHINVPRARYDLIKAKINALRHTDDLGRLGHAHCLSLEGQIDWVCTLNPSRGQKLRQLYARAINGG